MINSPYLAETQQPNFGAVKTDTSLSGGSLLELTSWTCPEPVWAGHRESIYHWMGK